MQKEPLGWIRINPSPLQETLRVENIYTFAYLEHPKNYVFPGERHSFWEFLYVDKGEIEVMAEDKGYKLSQGDIIFHKPGEFHSVWANRSTAPNLVVVTFDCFSPAMRQLEDKIFSLTDRQSAALAALFRVGKEVFSRFSIEDMRLVKAKEVPFGGEQLLKNALESFLIEMIRAGNRQSAESKLHVVMKERVERDLVSGVLKYMQEHLQENLCFSDICRANTISGTQLKALFKNAMGESVMRHWKRLKIAEAKRILREEGSNFTEISNRLGFSSLGHFSKCFKDYTGMTPTEYACSVQARVH